MRLDEATTDPTMPDAFETTSGLYSVTRRNVTVLGVDGGRFRQVVAEYGLDKLGDQTPYFTVTGAAWSARPGRMAAEPDMCGQLHGIIRRVFPSLADVIALHLSDPDGVPLHALANGWYWYGNGHEPYPAQWTGLTGPQRAASYLRAPHLDYFDAGLDRAGFEDRANLLRSEWSREASAAIVRHNLPVPS
jgi:hypothetical protein